MVRNYLKETPVGETHPYIFTQLYAAFVFYLHHTDTIKRQLCLAHSVMSFLASNSDGEWRTENPVGHTGGLKFVI